MSSKVKTVSLVFLCLVVPGTFRGVGQVYMWTDDQGIRHFSNISPPGTFKARTMEERSLTIPAGFSCRVIKVYDGDTIKVRTKSIEFKVRLAGIDSPESGWKTMPEQAMAREAKQALKDWILSKRVVLKQHGTGTYNRILAEVFLGDKNINLAMVRAGWAEVYQGKLLPSLDAGAFKQAEQEARQRKAGIWSLGSAYVSPKDWRKRFLRH